MTSPSTSTRRADPSFRCRGCGRTLTAAAAVLEHCADPHAQRPAICRGVLEAIGRDQLEPAGAGDRQGQADAGGGDGGGVSVGHEDSIAISRAVVDVNRTTAPGPSGSRTFTEGRNHA